MTNIIEKKKLCIKNIRKEQVEYSGIKTKIHLEEVENIISF